MNAPGKWDIDLTLGQAEAVRLRRDGVTYRDIAVRLCVSVATAHEYVRAALRKVLRPDVAELRDLENERLDALWKVVFPKALQCDYKAIDRCLRISERRAMLNGLDAPRKVDVTSGGAPLLSPEQQGAIADLEKLSHAERIARLLAMAQGKMPPPTFAAESAPADPMPPACGHDGASLVDLPTGTP